MKRNEIEKRRKKHHSRNALVHGLYAKDIILPWDSRADFEKLHADLKAEFSPHGRSEEEVVLELAILYWQKHTLWRMRQAKILKDPFTQDIRQTDCNSWSEIRKSLRASAAETRSLQNSASEDLARLHSLVKKLHEQIQESTDRDEIKILEQKVDAHLRTITERGVPLLQILMGIPTAEQAFDNAYPPESLEKIVRLEAMLDGRISKLLARLVALKEFKRTPAGGAGTNLIEARPALPKREEL